MTNDRNLIETFGACDCDIFDAVIASVEEFDPSDCCLAPEFATITIGDRSMTVPVADLYGDGVDVSPLIYGPPAGAGEG